MKGAVSWSYDRYLPPLTDGGELYVNRLAPGRACVHLEWADAGYGSYRVLLRLRGEGDFLSAWEGSGTQADIGDLEDGRDYECFVAAGEKKSLLRLFRTGEAVGTVVNYLHPDDKIYSFSGQYLCSPCLLRHPGGHLLASMDVYENAAPQNLEMIFRSDDDGKTWHALCQLYPCFWGRMFLHRGALYMLGVSTEYGDLLIGRSDDGGKTFCPPTVLFRGGCKCDRAGIHKNPQPPVTYGGRVWVTMEWGSWGLGYHAAMVASFPEDGDPMNVNDWRFTPPVKYDPAWPGTGKGESSGNIEGTLVVFPDGKLYNVMRYDMTRTVPNFGRVLAYRVRTDDPDAPLEYDHAIKLPGNHAKFTIRQDPVTGTYYTIICRITDPAVPCARNLLSLMKSHDCEHWELVCDLFDRRDADPMTIGFQYVDFLIEGEDILFLCRTAMNDPHNYHDSNYSTFHRIPHFRSL